MSKTSVLIGIVIGVLLTVAVLGGVPGLHGGALVQPAYAAGTTVAMCPLLWQTDRSGSSLVSHVVLLDSAGNLTVKTAPSF